MDLFDLSGKVAIVTGGNGGIGLGMAQGMAQAGAKIVILGRNTAKSQEAAQWLQAEIGADRPWSRPMCPVKPTSSEPPPSAGALWPDRHLVQ